MNGLLFCSLNTYLKKKVENENALFINSTIIEHVLIWAPIQQALF
jgi:hypothetical protein